MRAVPRLDDPVLDTMDQATQEAWLVDACRDQIRFAREHVPFWSNRLCGVDESKLGSLSDFAADVPILTAASQVRCTSAVLVQLNVRKCSQN